MVGAMNEPAKAGRKRDEAIDVALLDVAQRHLAHFGYEAMSLAAVAEEAGTTRQALYRRFSSKADLATAAVAAMSSADERSESDDPLSDLVRELQSFAVGVSRPNGMSLIGTMIQSSADPELVESFRQRLVEPRRDRIRSILRRGVQAKVLRADADVETAVSFCTGSWYAYAVAGARPPRDWPKRCAQLVWRSLQ